MADAPRLITLKFMLSMKYVKDPGLLAPIKIVPAENSQEREVRKKRESGTLVIYQEPKVGLEALLMDLEAAAYTLVGVKAQERVANDGRRYFMVRFIFAAREYMRPSPEFDAIRNTIGAKLACLACHAMWKAEVWRNPLYRDDAEVEGQHCIEVALKERDPLYEGTGPGKKSRLIWPKDADGNIVGTEKVPLKPATYLRLDKDTIVLDDNVEDDAA